MVHMLVHQLRPLFRRQLPEECMWMGRTTGRPCRNKPVDQSAEPDPLHAQIAIIEHNQRWQGGRILPHRLVVAQGLRFDEPAQYPSNRHPRRSQVSQRRLYPQRAVLHRLRRIHLAPKPRTIRLQQRNTLLHLIRHARIKEIFHAASLIHLSRPPTDSRVPLPRNRATQS